MNRRDMDMEKTIRIVELLTLLALEASLVPAMAAETRKPSIVAETLYPGTGTYTMTIDNWNWHATDVTTTSSDTNVLKVDK